MHQCRVVTSQVLNPTVPELVLKSHDERRNLIDDKLKELGVRGEPMFQSLSYFKCEAQLLIDHVSAGCCICSHLVRQSI